MTILITGADGFVGQHLIRYLIEIASTKIVTTTQKKIAFFSILSSDECEKISTLTEIDITNSQKINELILNIQPSVIYHLAAQSHVQVASNNPSETFLTNVLGTLNLFEAIERCGKNYQPTVLVTSSAQVYGASSNEVSVLNELTPTKPDNLYATSKLAQEYVALNYFFANKRNVIITRAFNHIGPGQSISFVVPGFAHQIAEIETGIKSSKIQVGNLEARRDFTDVRDIVRAYTLLIEKGKAGNIYNVCSCNTISVKEILNKLIELSIVKVEVEIDSNRLRNVDIPVLSGDNKKLCSTVDWSAKIPLSKSLQDILEEQRKIAKVKYRNF